MINLNSTINIDLNKVKDSKYVLHYIKKRCTMSNPVYFRTKAIGYSTHNVEPLLKTC